MAALPEPRIAQLLAPYVPDAVTNARLAAILPQLSVYLDLLLRWNSRTNLTAIREPEEIVRRHFGESLFTAAVLQPRLPGNATLLDFGSGAGFPGLPIQLYAPELACVLAESQGKKASFLREVIRSVGTAAEVWAARAETMPEERRFTCVTMRAVDDIAAALPLAAERVASGGWLAILAGKNPVSPDESSFHPAEVFPIPESEARMLYLYTRR